MNVATRPMMLSGVSEQEWQIRCDLAALYRLVAHHRWTDFVYTHISARLPGPEHHFLINKYGVLFDEMRASDLVKIDLHGNVVEEGDVSSRRVNAAGFTIHSAIHHGPPGLALRRAHAHPGGDRGLGNDRRSAAAVAARAEILRPPGVSRLRGDRPGPRRTRAPGARPRRAQGDDPAQPWAAGRRHLDRRGVPHDLHAGARLRGPGRNPVRVGAR